MDKKIHPRLSLLSDDAFSIVTSTSVKQNIPPNEALSYIIEDWEEMNEDREHKVVDAAKTYQYVLEYLQKLDARLSSIEGMVTDISFEVEK